MIKAAKKRVPAWTLGIALAAGIGIGLAMPIILDWWRVPVCAALIVASGYLLFRRK